MTYTSSRNINDNVSAGEAIINGHSKDGGLYTPTSFDSSFFDIDTFKNLSYKEIAYKVFKYFFDDFDENDLKKCIDDAYKKFYTKEIVPIYKLHDDYVLELYHGPTSAFKDVALTILPHLLNLSYKKQNINKKIYILCATSGDTGKAALEGFKDVPNTFITVFYPHNAVSKIQELQMTTTTGNNTNVVAVKGNFDDCQKIVKDLMNKREELLDNKPVLFSSANSINLGRLIPQIVYYIYTYSHLLDKQQINKNEKINFIVPSGNFGDILAGYIAKALGTPINKLICASNKNNVLTDFINTGIYNKNRNFYNTKSPSMDILVSSNLERLLFIKSNYNSELIKKYFDELTNKGEYQVNNEILEGIKKDFNAYFAEEDEVVNAIKKIYNEHKYLIDPHTACAYVALNKYKKETNDNTKNVILSTASPFKFARTVEETVRNTTFEEIYDDSSFFEDLEMLGETKTPPNLQGIYQKRIMHYDIIEKTDAEMYVRKIIDNLK